MFNQGQFDRRKYDHMNTDAKIDLVLELLEAMSYAFPDGPIKHREAHEAMLEAKKAETRFYEALRLELAKKGSWFLLSLLVGLLVYFISTKLGISVNK